MAKKQSRRSLSVRGATYAAIRLDCAARDLSLSDYVEQLIADDRKRRGLPAITRPIEAVVTRALARAPLPSQSVIKAGPPPEQGKLIDRTPVRCCTYTMGAFSCRADAGKDGRCGKHPLQGSAWRGKMAPRAEEVQAVRAARIEPPKANPVRTSTATSGRAPHASDRVPPPDPARDARNVRMF